MVRDQKSYSALLGLAASGVLHLAVIGLFAFYGHSESRIPRFGDPNTGVRFVEVRGEKLHRRPMTKSPAIDPTPALKNETVTSAETPATQTLATVGSDSAQDAIARGEIESRYMSELTLLLNRDKRYPREARLKEQEGNVTVAVAIDRDGLVHESKIETPSPFEILNQAALATIARVGRFPPPPETLLAEAGPHGTGSLRLKIPLTFKLERR